MNILALDMATKTGWAAKRKEGGVIYGVQEFGLKRGESPGMRFLRCRKWLNEMLVLMGGIDVISYEQAHHRGGAATQCCVGLTTVVLEFAAANAIETMPVHTATLKKFATGSGRANKDDMLVAAKKRGYNPIDDNEADALMLLHYTFDQV